MPIVALPDGGQAVLYDKLTVAGRRVLAPAFAEMISAVVATFPKLKDFKDLNLSDQDMATLMLGGADGRMVATSMDFQAAAIVAFVKEWTYGPLPTTDTVLRFTDDPEVFDALAAAVAPLAVKAMKVGEFGPAGARDPSSPTVPSPGSEAGGRADPPSTTPSPSQTPPPSSGSESGSTDVSFT